MDEIAELIDRLERHKAALQGQAELKVGPHMIIMDFDDAIRTLLELRDPPPPAVSRQAADLVKRGKLTQSEAARLAGCSRQRINQLVRAVHQ